VFIERTPDFAIFALDKTGVISSWNPAAERMKGYKASEIIGKHFSVLFPPSEFHNRTPQYLLARALQDGRAEDVGWRVRKDGGMLWADEIITPIRADDGSCRGFVKVTRDLSHRRQEQEAQRLGEQRYRFLVESVRDYAIFLLDPEGRVMSWNEGAQRLKGYSAEEAIGQHFRLFYTEADRARGHPEEELRRALAEGSYNEEGWRVRKDGSSFWASVNLTPIHDEHGKVLGFAKVTRDLTERKEAEDALRERNERLDRLNRELDAFSGAVAHDLRAPLRAIRTLVDEVHADPGNRLTRASKEQLEAVQTSTFRMAQLIEDLLELSASERREPRRGDVDVSAIAERVVAAIQDRHPARRARFVIDPSLRAKADPDLLEIVLTNLLRNASKFARDRDPAVIEVGRASTPRGEAFFVRDNGVGFDPARERELFQPFQRLHGASFEGTGLGLTTVRRIVERHGGTVWAEGQPDRGATFYFTIP
jgi:PAS domain S-box-containing protein